MKLKEEMKRNLMVFGVLVALFIGGSTLIGCGNSSSKSANAGSKENVESEKTSESEGHSHGEETHVHKHYQCPMKCEEEKVYEAEGTCPVCKMDLKVVEA